MYDLKGSLKGRKIKVNEGEDRSQKVQKDLDFMSNQEHISLTKEDSNDFNDLIQKDSEFLSDLEIMDYSLFFVKLTCTDAEVPFN